MALHKEMYFPYKLTLRERLTGKMDITFWIPRRGCNERGCKNGVEVPETDNKCELCTERMEYSNALAQIRAITQSALGKG